jgi:hypothetical protein
VFRQLVLQLVSRSPSSSISSRLDRAAIRSVLAEQGSAAQPSIRPRRRPHGDVEGQIASCSFDAIRASAAPEGPDFNDSSDDGLTDLLQSLRFSLTALGNITVFVKLDGEKMRRQGPAARPTMRWRESGRPRRATSESRALKRLPPS